MGDVADLLATDEGEGEPMREEPVQVIRDLQRVGERAKEDPPSECQIKFATELVRGHSVVEISGNYTGAAV